MWSPSKFNDDDWIKNIKVGNKVEYEDYNTHEHGFVTIKKITNTGAFRTNEGMLFNINGYWKNKCFIKICE